MVNVETSKVLMNAQQIRELPSMTPKPVLVSNTPDADFFIPTDRRVEGEVAVRTAGHEIEFTLSGNMRARTYGTNSRGIQVTREDAALYLGRAPTLVGRRTRCRNEPRAPANGWLSWAGLVGSAPATRQMFEAIARAADGDAPVWLRGESGTGKEMAARALHTFSPRANGPFVTLNCAALPESLIEAELFGVVRGAFTGAHQDRPGAFQRADGGTLFLDEIGELPLAVQAKLLRALEVGEVTRVGGGRIERTNVRIVTATWRDLEQEVSDGRFRHDLLHRLWVLRVELPPLRDRSADIAELVAARLAERDAMHLFPDATMLRALASELWPGNVRQLHNQIERAIAYDDPALLLPNANELRPRALVPRRDAWQDGGRAPDPKDVCATITRQLQRHRGNRSQAAKALGISRSTLYRWLQGEEYALCQ